MLTFREYNKTFRKRKTMNVKTNKSQTNTILGIDDFIDFLSSVEHPMIQVIDDGDWYRFRFVDAVETNGT
jgi:hypothetical protein